MSERKPPPPENRRVREHSASEPDGEHDTPHPESFPKPGVSENASQSSEDLRRAMNAALGAQAKYGVSVTADTLPALPMAGAARPARGDLRPQQTPTRNRSLRASGSPGSSGPSAGWQQRGPLLKRILLWVLLVGLGFLLAGVIAVFFTVRHYEANLPSVEQLRAGYDPPQVTRVLARDGTLLANLFTERRTVVPFSQIPSHVKQAFLAAEDASFYEHEGLDYLGMLRALWANLRAGRTSQGGSTITQQVIKNVLLDSERSYQRKIKETILARRVEQHLTKDEIFGLYLNHIYLGHGRYGVEEAARYYFGKKVSEIDVAEAALLAGLVAAPERYSPRKHPEKALERRKYVLGQMLAKGFMTAALHEQASMVPMKIAPAVEAESELCPEVIASVRKILSTLDPDRARHGGYTVHTSIDPALQAAARQAVRDNLDRYLERQKLLPPFTKASRKLWGEVYKGTPKRHKIYVGMVSATNDAAGTIDVMLGDTLGRVMLKDEERYNPKHLPPSEFAKAGAALRVAALDDPSPERGPIPLKLELGPQSALVAIDVRTREVRALVGSYEAMMGGLDRTGSSAEDQSLMTKRQPGSSFKPIMYSYALHSRHFTPASVFEFPSKTNADDPPRRLSLRNGVAQSDNEVAESVLKRVGAANVVSWAKAMGVGSELKPDLSLALGSYEVSVFELTNAYATLASGGTFAAPRLITKVVANDGSELSLPPVPPQRRVMSEEEAYLTTSLLRGVVENGTGKRALALGRPVAGKTGTTNKNRDAWFVGYSTEYVAGCWTGYDDSLPLGWGEYGAVAALPAWVDFMKVAHQGHPRTQFPRPHQIVKALIDPQTGLLPYLDQKDAIEEEFLPDSLPSEQAPPPELAADAGAPDSGVPDASAAPDATPEIPEGTPDPKAPGATGGAPEPTHDKPVEHPSSQETTDTAGALPDPEPPPF